MSFVEILFHQINLKEKKGFIYLFILVLWESMKNNIVPVVKSASEKVNLEEIV